MTRYLSEHATGAPATLKAKGDDLKTFLEWFTWAYGGDSVERWNRAATNAFLQALQSARDEAEKPRWANRSINRKLDHLRTFARWILAQVPCPLFADPMQGIKRLDVPLLQAQRISDRDMLRLETAARNLIGTETKRDRKRITLGTSELRKNTRPFRDYAIFALLRGSGLRVQAVASLNLEQVQGRRLVKVKEKGSQERDVVISSDAMEALRHYIETERPIDADAWNGGRSLFLSIPCEARKRNDGLKGRMDVRTVRYVIEKIARKALGDEGASRIHPHLFRHNMGFLMNEKGGITAVQRQLAHKNITYSAVYCQRTDEELEGYLDEGDARGKAPKASDPFGGVRGAW